ncbi:hypothetical protein RI129_001549 [Pyrocoelia pectoralis]|uniref:mitogen-activated protein kinase kinase n=1 Tax=Pyrocoelia pectoralis TaxID=417401 RepID=A0AAN7VNG2_9COLE
MSSPESKISDLLERLKNENSNSRSSQIPTLQNIPAKGVCRRPGGPNLGLGNLSNTVRRPQDLNFSTKRTDNLETDRKLKEIMKISGKLKIKGITYMTELKDLEHIEELGNGTCGHVVKMLHRPSKEIIAVKQMRRSGNSEENKRIIMDIEVVIKSHDCPFIVHCLGCFITDAEVWICMELMSTCFDKLLKRLKRAIPEDVIGKVTVATVKALSYLKETHGVIHRDVKPSNILLDERGNVKLCDFGISGRLVDSMAKTRSAGCAAYMAPERIEPDPNNPDYDIRADVWSLGITLVELATGVYPYQDCKTDFEVLTKVIDQDPPILPENKDFSPEFRQFVSLCLTKDPKQRPKYNKLQNERFIRNYETADVNVGKWFRKAMEQADLLTNKKALPRPTASPLLSVRRQNVAHQRQLPEGYNSTHITLTNGSSCNVPHPTEVNSTNPFTSMEYQIKQSYQISPPSLPPDGRSPHLSRYSAFHNSSSSNIGHQRDSSLPYTHQSISDKHLSYNQSVNVNDNISVPSTNVRGFSPFRTFQSSPQYNYITNNIPIASQRYIDGEMTDCSSPLQIRKVGGESRRQSPGGSPLPLRNQIQGSQEHIYGNTSPIVLQRFYHQQKQQQKAQEAEEAAKDDLGKPRFASYMKLQLSGDRSGRSSRHQSPEPPPRYNRGASAENQSPLSARHGNSLASPSLSRRYISPSPPVPPPRRLSESASVPGSPQHLRARFHYTPEPQRRLYQSNDVSS